MDLLIKKQSIGFRDGFRVWEITEEKVTYPAEETALIIVDMWDNHWSSGATRRSAILAPKINRIAKWARDKGILVVNAASSVMDFYEGNEARNRFLSVPKLEVIPEPITIVDYPLPIDDSDRGSDTPDTYPPQGVVWRSRQNAVIEIDQSRDIICGDEGDQLFSYLTAKGSKYLNYTGVAANMCVLNRTFGIKKMLRRGMQTILVRDLTDTMYNPEKPPYVSHDEGTALVVSYIEKFYCPTIDSGQI
jgi:nicotinamidase-related amidase